MSEYHKIQSLFKRDERTKRFIDDAWTLPEFEYLQHATWEFTEKVDGTNIRIYWNGETVRFGGRTNNAHIPTFLYDRLVALLTPDKLRAVFPENPCAVVLYGEGYGARIQKGGGNYKADGVDFVLFDVRIADWWLERANVNGIAEALGVQVVPVVGEGTVHDAIAMVQRGFRSTWGPFEAEGLVLRPKVQLFTRLGDRLIAKVKARDYAHLARPVSAAETVEA